MNRGEHTVFYERFDGGLNLWDEESRLAKNETPQMQNLWWEGGALCSRQGQTYVTGAAENAVGYAASPAPFHGRTFLHISSGLYALDHTAPAGEDGLWPLEEVYTGVPRDRGTFFRYGEHLYYKNRGGFYQIAYTPEGETLFTVRPVADLAYVPTTVLSADAKSGSGDLYQPENRLTGCKRVKYNAAVTEDKVIRTGDGASRIFLLGTTAAEGLVGVRAVYFGMDGVDTALYECNPTTGAVTFTAPPVSGAVITFVLDLGEAVYHLPERDVDAVESVRVEGTLLTPETDYTVDILSGTVTFLSAPQPTERTNTVEIVYRKDNPAAKESILSCRCGGVYGTGVEVCMVLGGCAAQPNAVFWNGNNDAAMDPAYFPMPFYNLCGDGAESVTGFGRQYTDLVIFKERSLGKAGFSVEQVNGRDSISLTYQRVNDSIGCDLPWSIRLIGNNLVFANSTQGVFTVDSASAALENNVSLLSRNVNGSARRPGLLNDLEVTMGTEGFAFDDGERYWLCVNGKAYLWDYLLSTASKPCWFRFTDIRGISFWRCEGKTYHLSADGRVSVMGSVLSDYGAGIEKVYRFPPIDPGAFARHRDILRMVFTLRCGSGSAVQVRYKTENGEWDDPTPIRITAAGLAPRDLTRRDLSVPTECVVAVRYPRCWHIGWFSATLHNSAAGEDMAVLSAQLTYRQVGRYR